VLVIGRVFDNGCRLETKSIFVACRSVAKVT